MPLYNSYLPLWRWRRESNSQPIAYKAIALPLCYTSIWRRHEDSNPDRPLDLLMVFKTRLLSLQYDGIMVRNIGLGPMTSSL